MENDLEFNEAQIIKEALLEKFRQETKELPDICMAVYLKVFLEDKDAVHIARDLNVTLDTVRVQFQKALHLLTSKFLKEGLNLRLCDHRCKVGDNYGITCGDCGAILEGYGYRAQAIKELLPGQSPVCKHAWYAEDHMFLAMCTWCQAKTPNPNYLIRNPATGSGK